MKLAVPQFLKSSKPKPVKAKPPLKLVALPAVTSPPSPPPPHRNGLPARYLRRRQVMRLLGITKYEFRKWVEAGLLKPHKRGPDAHRLAGKNRERGQRALFLLSEVEAVKLENV
jgi:hypothetical protein